MNKKLIAMILVPVLVVMGGALAFSAFTGTAVTNVSASAGNVNFNIGESSYYLYGYAHPVDPSYGTPTATSAETYVSAANLSPGSWVEFNVTLNVTATVPVTLSEAIALSGTPNAASGTVTTSNYSVSSSAFVYGQELTETNPGFYYNVSSTPSITSSTVLMPNSSGVTQYTFHIFVGLANTNNDNGMIGATFGMDMTITLTSAD